MAIGYRELANVLRSRIEDGTYPTDESKTLPKHEELAEEFEVNVKTVRQAIRLLEAEGLVTVIRRRGTVIRPRPRMKRQGAERYAKSKWKFGLVAFAADREVSGRTWSPSDQTNKVRKVHADKDVAEALGLPEGSPVYERARLVKDGATPTHTLTSYYRPEHVEGTPLVDPTPGPAGYGGGFAVLTLQGFEPDNITESLQARMPTPDEIDELQLPVGQPVVVLKRLTFTRDGQVVEFARGVHSAAHFEWSYNFKIPD
ncbi:putative HTH-type transcriptional regulator [Sphaerisporangium krabiense]|uniref:GntR family transcriptional regulator n=1 Tax=Sphaerisporangium krabiense TaxID=763782 RepID=A0A7W8Z8Y0_9ACTN|nr:GntR family transcriptional regulator [Sphaerisporangium krabiense]MBB5629516.1 GntR family transcriptional regulator [Sphaerisporangium krabiense]GII65632.1 putative HTH-type transcriptional regulator [Sphaerisporangium krabiense]